MNRVILIGRLTKDPEIRYTQTGDRDMAIARYTLAVNRRTKKDGEQQADFIRCIAFGSNGQFAEKYFTKGMKIVVEGRIQTGSYTNQAGEKVYTTDIVVDSQEFAESKNSNSEAKPAEVPGPDGFINIPDGVEDEGLPFN